MEPRVERFIFPSLRVPSRMREELSNWAFIFESVIPRLEKERVPSLRMSGEEIPFGERRTPFGMTSPS